MSFTPFFSHKAFSFVFIALDAFGNIKEGFPYVSTKRFNSPPTLADIDGNGTFEIIAGNDDGLLHILYFDS